MSTTVPHDDTIPSEDTEAEVHWQLYRGDGDILSRDEFTWDEISTLQDIDGIHLSVARVPAIKLCLSFLGVRTVLEPFIPTHFFALRRVAVSLGGSSQPKWRYSLFGYVSHDERHTIQIYPGEMIVRSVPRSLRFQL